MIIFSPTMPSRIKRGKQEVDDSSDDDSELEEKAPQEKPKLNRAEESTILSQRSIQKNATKEARKKGATHKQPSHPFIRELNKLNRDVCIIRNAGKECIKRLKNLEILTTYYSFRFRILLQIVPNEKWTRLTIALKAKIE